MKRTIPIFIFTLVLFSCNKPDKTPPIDDKIDLDGKIINDSSIVYPERFLQSKRTLSPTDLEKKKRVYVCAHGFTASTFEWLEFRDFVEKEKNAFTSLVLLGGHGRDYEIFKNTTWQDWQKPIIDEVTSLMSLGYESIYLIGSSTGCPLILDALKNSKLNSNVKGIYLIDPIIVPSTKTLSLINGVGPLLGYSESEMEKGENGFWYKYRPYQSLKELNKITQLVRSQLEKGINSSIPITVYKSIKDGSADPISAPLIKKGIKGIIPSIKMIDSELHVFTRLKGRNTYLDKDLKNQETVFNELLNKK